MLFSAVFRAKARAALSGRWQTALLIALVVNLPSLLVQGIAAFTNNDLAARLEDLLYRASYDAEALNGFAESAKALLSDSGILAMSGLGLLAWLVTPALSLGMNHWTLERLRGADLPVSAVFSRLRIFLKSIGLRLFILLKVLLWMLPGLAVSLTAVIPLLNADPSASDTLLSAVETSLGLMYFGMAVMAVLGVMGYLYYALADFILADEPEEGVLSCARRSKILMNGRRSALMSLLLSFVLWYFLVIIVSSFAAGIAGTVVGLLLEMLGSLFLTVYMLASEAAFYEVLRLAPAPEIPLNETDN